MQVHVVDGTYELFRYHYSPGNRDAELGATRGVVGSMLQLLESGATHVGVATDHVIESFRNELWPSYKDGSGIEAALKAQFPIVEEALETAGVCTWPMVELEADDALGAAAKVAAADERVKRVLVCTPDKDLGQCVGGKVVQWDRRLDIVYDAAAVTAKFGVGPESIPDYLALVGDSADGFPGLPGWGSKSAGAVLAAYGHLESIPPAGDDWSVDIRNKGRLALVLRESFELALLFRRIATLESDAEVLGDVDELEWRGPTAGFPALCEHLGMPALAVRADSLATKRGFSRQ
ncbi:MAG: 5'-3' exonuclease [Acidimicrobiales bacterium]